MSESTKPAPPAAPPPGTPDERALAAIRACDNPLRVMLQIVREMGAEQ